MLSDWDGGLSLNFVHRRIGGGIAGFLQAGPAGAVAGFLDANGGTMPTVGRAVDFVHVHPSTGRTHTHFAGEEAPCPGIGSIRGPGGVCINLGDLGPGGAPAITQQTGTDLVVTPGQGEPVIGAFGVSAMTPFIVGQVMDHHGVMRPIRRCLAGAVLGMDDLCYPSNMRGLQRKWKRHRCASPLDRKLKALKDAGSAVTSLKNSLKGTGFKISKT